MGIIKRGVKGSKEAQKQGEDWVNLRISLLSHVSYMISSKYCFRPTHGEE
jgi:hypothetical protein